MGPSDPILIHTHDPIYLYTCVWYVCCCEYIYLHTQVQICDWNHTCLCAYLWFVRLGEI